jgi:hypothetical protein
MDMAMAASVRIPKHVSDCEEPDKEKWAVLEVRVKCIMTWFVLENPCQPGQYLGFDKKWYPDTHLDKLVRTHVYENVERFGKSRLEELFPCRKIVIVMN